jgi:hypothetical protein
MQIWKWIVVPFEVSISMNHNSRPHSIVRTKNDQTGSEMKRVLGLSVPAER